MTPIHWPSWFFVSRRIEGEGVPVKVLQSSRKPVADCIREVNFNELSDYQGASTAIATFRFRRNAAAFPCDEAVRWRTIAG
jgi:hypothetical protein